MRAIYPFWHLYCVFIFFILLSSCRGQTDTSTATIQKIEEQIPQNKKPYQISKSMVRSIFEDSNGNYWFGRDHAGLSMYDGHVLHHYTVDDGLKDNQIRTIQEDPSGDIWFATGGGLSRYDGTKFTIETIASNIFPNILSENQWHKDNDDLWFNGENDGGIYRYDGHRLSVLQLPVIEEDALSYSIQGTITGICHGQNDMLWIANYDGVIGYDGSSFHYISDRQYMYHVRSIYEDSKGNLWIGNNGIGVLLYDGQATTNFSENMTTTRSLNPAQALLKTSTAPYRVFAIAEDSLGNIWFGDRDTGAWRYDGTSLTRYTMKDGLTNNMVRSIYRDRKGEMWFGLGDGSVCIFDGQQFQKKF